MKIVCKWIHDHGWGRRRLPIVVLLCVLAIAGGMGYHISSVGDTVKASEPSTILKGGMSSPR